MNLVKTEILWTRRCPLNCSYCAMADGRTNSPTLELWKKGVDNLRELDCRFIAFYGAEPLYDFDKLPEVVGYAEKQGIPSTVITSGRVPEFKAKLNALYKVGCRSLSMSYDVVGLDKSSSSKSSIALEGLEYFKSLGEYRDVAAIATMTRLNHQLFPSAIEMLSKRNIWFFFDFVHDDRGQIGSKCRSSFTTKELLFRDEDIPSLLNTLERIMVLKQEGFLCHTSKAFTNLVTKRGKIVYDWHCKTDCFPSWVTVDCDGEVGICDDFRPTVSKQNQVFLWQLADRWKNFSEYWQDPIKECPGCLWNTHVDADLIKAGKLDITEYVHGLEDE